MTVIIMRAQDWGIITWCQHDSLIAHMIIKWSCYIMKTKLRDSDLWRSFPIDLNFLKHPQQKHAPTHVQRLNPVDFEFSKKFSEKKNCT